MKRFIIFKTKIINAKVELNVQYNITKTITPTSHMQLHIHDIHNRSCIVYVNSDEFYKHEKKLIITK